VLADIRYSTIGIALAITLGWISICGLLGNLGTLVPVAVLGMASIGYVLWRAAQRQRWALLAVLSGVLILLDVVFLSRDKGEPGLDAQNGMKLLGWIGLLGVCALNLPEIKKSFRDPAILAHNDRRAQQRIVAVRVIVRPGTEMPVLADEAPRADLDRPQRI